MAPKNCSSFALFLALNILLFAFVSASVNCPIPTPPTPPSPPTPDPNPTPTPSTTSCPRDTLKLGVCSSVLGGMFNFTMGDVPSTPCCSFLGGLADFDVAICICTALKANIMGFNVDIPISFTQLLNFCSRQAPANFLCLPDTN